MANISIHDVKREDYDKLDYPEGKKGLTRWKTIEVYTKKGELYDVTFFPEEKKVEAN